MEIFTFLSMGAGVDRVCVRPLLPFSSHLSARDELFAQLRNSFLDFDARGAQCYKVEDRKRLLGIIEEAFGDFEAFNGLVRQMFVPLFDPSTAALSPRVRARESQRSMTYHFPRAFRRGQSLTTMFHPAASSRHLRTADLL